MKNKAYIIYLVAAILMGFAAYWFMWQSPSFWLAVGGYDKLDFDSPDESHSWREMNPGTVRKLVKATLVYGGKLIVNRAYSSVTHNADVGGVDGSSHVGGYAFDIAHHGDSQGVVDALWEAGFRRIGIYATHIHADDDPEKKEAVWYS